MLRSLPDEYLVSWNQNPATKSKPVCRRRKKASRDLEIAFGVGSFKQEQDKREKRYRSPNLVLTYKGQTKTAAQWGKQLGLNPQTIRMRIKGGWPVELALEHPVTKPGSVKVLRKKKDDSQLRQASRSDN